MRKKRSGKRRTVIYKPDYAGVHQIAVAKRVVGILLAVMLLSVIVLAAVWLLPSVWNALQPSPQQEEMKEQTLEEKAEAEGTSLILDEKTGLPLFENGVNLFVVNEASPADENFAPVLETVSGVEVDRRIAPALDKLMEDARAQGHEISLIGGYVSYDAQKEMYEAEVKRLLSEGNTKIIAYAYAKDTAALPGTSDMQSGMCVTLQGEDETFATTALCVWLENNMAKYGFVFRYPEGKENYTGQEGTKLVLRYVGPGNAAAMRRLSMSLEEYIDYLK